MGMAATVPETEQDLIQTAQRAISSCNWTVGECATKWTKRFARGRTDADFGALVGLSGDQVYQRRRVWEAFSDVKDQHRELKWSHYYVALTWNDSADCLTWAEENAATVAEMKAWRRLQHGEDLTIDAESDLDLNAAAPGYGDTILYQKPEAIGESGELAVSSDTFLESQTSANRVDVVTGSATVDAGAGYAPFRKGAGTPPPAENGEDYGPVTISVDEVVKRMTTALERCNRLLTDELISNFPQVPEKIRERFLTAVEILGNRVSGLS